MELVALGGDQLLALERGFTAGVGNTVRLYRVSATGVPDVSGVESLATLTDPRAWLGKQLLVDVADCPPAGATAKQPQPNPLLDNIEGMALGAGCPAGGTCSTSSPTTTTTRRRPPACTRSASRCRPSSTSSHWRGTPVATCGSATSSART